MRQSVLTVAPRTRILAFGTAAGLVIAGSVCAAVIGGAPGAMLALILIGLGLVGATGLVFLEVGLSEDRERLRDVDPGRGSRRGQVKRSKLLRSRSHRRELR